MNKKMLFLLPIMLGVGFAYYNQQPETAPLPIEQLMVQNEDELFETVDFSSKPITVEPLPLPPQENYTFERKDTQTGKELSWDYQGNRDFKVKGVVEVEETKPFRYRSSMEEPLGKAEVRFSNGNVEISTKGEVDKQGRASGRISIGGKFP